MPFPSRFPSRLIQIGDKNVDNQLHLSLLETSTFISDDHPSQISLNYATLSHRWGQSNHFTTTKETLQSRQSGFLFTDLPQTYKDAVIVTQRLGLDLLWIDALCIIQDDSRDWLVESEKMGDVYQNARFTIAAHCARHDDEGFLSAALQKRETLALGDARPFFLCKRAWVLQERFLSSRTFHFTEGHVYWETIEGVYSEEGPITPVEWSRLVEMYTRCGLTKEEDKLIAISGLAKRIHIKSNVGYLAGLWADRLHSGLLWMTEVEPLRKPTLSRAPSWSWASMEGPIQY
ncbi:HET-domain-containing protein, partial [Byssothecium circinans]